MEAKASARFVRVTPMKARRVVNLIRGKQAEEALAILKFRPPRQLREPVYKIVASAVANARQKATQQGLPFREEELFISEAFVNEGPTMKRIQPPRSGSRIPNQPSAPATSPLSSRARREVLSSGPENPPPRPPAGITSDWKSQLVRR